MIEPSAGMLRLLVEWAEHALPVGTLFAGVTFAMVFVERTSRGTAHEVRNRVVRRLTSSFVCMICAVVSSALLLLLFGFIEGLAEHRAERWALSDKVRSGLIDAALEERRLAFVGLWGVGLVGMLLGVTEVLRAIGLSGGLQDREEGRRTRWIEYVGWGVIGLSLTLFVWP